MNVTLLAHTQLSENFITMAEDPYYRESNWKATHGQTLLLTAIRTCYSSNKPSEIIEKEGEKYFNNDNKEFNRLFGNIFGKHHHSVLEHVSFTFAVEGVSRSLLAQLTRHRHESFSVQSQRYVRFSNEDKSGGFEYIVPESVKVNGISAEAIFKASMKAIQEDYNALRSLDVPAEDARFVLPNAATANLVLTMNLRSLFEFYAKRQRSKGAQWEIAELAEKIREEVVKVEPWLDEYFDKIINE